MNRLPQISDDLRPQIESALFDALLAEATDPPVLHRPFNLAQPPFQGPVERAGAESIVFKGFELVPVAAYQVDARILSRKDYLFDDWANIAPVDLVLGWGALALPDNANQLSHDQADRAYYWWYENSQNLTVPFVRSHVGMTHVIPMTKSLEDDLFTARPGDVVTIQGWLVDLINQEGLRWHTSTVREDYGPSSTEFLLATALVIRR